MFLKVVTEAFQVSQYLTYKIQHQAMLSRDTDVRHQIKKAY